MTTDNSPVRYCCPGEEHPIPRSVHLSRLASFFPKCRDCRHRDDTGQLTRQTLEAIASTRKRVERPTLFTDEGVRGVHLNELTRKRAADLAGALASLLWQDRPLRGRRRSSPPVNPSPSRPAGPAVVVGYDPRPSSPDIVAGVVAALVRMGCRVIELGRVSGPCLQFAVDHLQAAAGLFVTGAGHPAAWTGLDAVVAAGRPLSRGGGLERWEARVAGGFARPTRRSGSRRAFRATPVYEAALGKHFDSLPPLTVSIGCPAGPVTDTLVRSFAHRPVRLDLLEPPLGPPSPTFRTRLAESVRRQGAVAGVLCHDDAGRIDVLDEQGQPVPVKTVARLLGEAVLAEKPAGAVILAEQAGKEFEADVVEAGGYVRWAGSGLAATWRAMRDHQAVFASDAEGRYWFHEAAPTCDAVVTIGRLLEALARARCPLSQATAGSGEPTG